MPWTIRLRAEEGSIVESADYRAPDVAMDAYRVLLARTDLVGEPVAAVFKPPAGTTREGNVSTFFSRFDKPVGGGRIDPRDTRLDPWATQYDARTVAESVDPNLPAPPRPPVDWEGDERAFPDALKAWARQRGGRDAASEDLRVSRKTLDGWCDGRGAAQERLARRAMTLIDRVEPKEG